MDLWNKNNKKTKNYIFFKIPKLEMKNIVDYYTERIIFAYNNIYKYDNIDGCVIWQLYDTSFGEKKSYELTVISIRC